MSEKESKIVKRAEEIAEASNITVDAAIKLFSFLDDLFGNVISNSFGVIGDTISHHRSIRSIKL